MLHLLRGALLNPFFPHQPAAAGEASFLSRAELDINFLVASAAEAIRHVEKATLSKCCRMTNERSELDVIPSSDVDDFLRQQMPLGVTSIERIEITTVRVCYVATAIGARQLLQDGFNAPIQLAPPRDDQVLAAGSRHVRHVGYMTLLSSLLTIPSPCAGLGASPKASRHVRFSVAGADDCHSGGGGGSLLRQRAQGAGLRAHGRDGLAHRFELKCRVHLLACFLWLPCARKPAFNQRLLRNERLARDAHHGWALC